MARVAHGAVVTIEQAESAVAKTGTVSVLNIPFSMDIMPDFRRFDFLFPGLQKNPDNLLPESPDTVKLLKELGAAMRDTSPDDELNSQTPAAYTYLGQFIDHDITFEMVSGTLQKITDPNLTPISVEDVKTKIKNTRSATLDLDSVYEGLARRDGEKMKIGTVTSLNGTEKPLLRPANKLDDNDLDRRARSDDAATDREALIGDPRNDENTIVSQLHLAFLKAHNSIVERGHNFVQARRLLRQHYQWIVIHDFLMRIADPEIVKRVLLYGNQIYNPEQYDFFMPVEFTAAAYRFGHTMVRANYDFNLNFNLSGEENTFPASLEFLFTFTALSGQLGGNGVPETDTLPDNWIIEWERFFPVGETFNKARRFDTKLVEPLFLLRHFDGTPLPDEARLSVRNLLRGYLLRIPTGQAVARALNLTPLTAAQIEAAAANEAQAEVLRRSEFNERTPLWFYILAEAASSGGERLGELGSILVSEVLIGLIRRSEDSFLASDNWTPALGAEAGKFDLTDLLKLAGVLN